MTTVTNDIVTSVKMASELREFKSDGEKAAYFKDEANQIFKDQLYDVAIELYSLAIDILPSAVLYANRSMANMKRELYGSALEDADRAIELDPKYIKGYYRRATANMALSRFKKALADYATVVKVCPNDPDAKRKHEECQKIVKKKAFLDAIAMDHTEKKPLAEAIDWKKKEVESSYDGPHLGEQVTREFMVALIECFKQQGKLHIKYAYKIIIDIFNYFRAQPSMVEINVPAGKKFTICGDVHGQFFDLVNIFEINGLPSEDNPYLFNGDFVDRGSFGVETIFTLLGFKLLYPNHFFMSRGNHESDVMNKMYGFEGEVRAKYEAQMSDLFTETFCQLPLCHLINKKIFVCHGGLFSKDGVTLDQIRKVDRVRQPPDEGIMCDLLWSDPQPIQGRAPSKRGVGCQFGPDVSKKWCEENDVEYVVRSHEVKPDGWEEHHNGRVYTVFSAPNYCDQMGNKGAFITITGDNLKPKFTEFEAVDHPTLPPMAYARNGGFFPFFA
ncbi:hypothetical protein WR25_04152 [Diploscapter pachys]|uniref:protein-serine/threonine phosphatase n=1 Tax=Diploscapter pachys TaxID=2018661 RepID=A0A2A2J4P6_9BILA|nr:hypothetical protein WR25_04152 [Diploscapter pachys]